MKTTMIVHLTAIVLIAGARASVHIPAPRIPAHNKTTIANGPDTSTFSTYGLEVSTLESKLEEIDPFSITEGMTEITTANVPVFVPEATVAPRGNVFVPEVPVVESDPSTFAPETTGNTTHRRLQESRVNLAAIRASIRPVIPRSTVSSVIDYDSGVSIATRAPIPQPPRRKIEFQPEEAQVVRVAQNDLHDGLPLPGFLVKVITDDGQEHGHPTYKMTLSNPVLSDHLILAPSRGQGRSRVYLLVKSASDLAAAFERIDGPVKKVDMQIIAQLENDQRSATLGLTLIMEASKQLKFTQDRYEFMTMADINHGTELGSVKLENAIRPDEVTMQVYGEGRYLFSLQPDGRLVLRCPSSQSPCLKPDKQWTLVCVAVKGQQRSQPVQIVVKTTSTNSSGPQLRCSPDRIRIVNGEMTRPMVCLVHDPLANVEALSLRVTTESLRPYFSFQKLATSRWILVKHADLRADNYTMTISLVESAVIKTSTKVDLLVEENDNGVHFTQNPYSLTLGYKDAKPGRILTKVGLVSSEVPVSYFLTNGADTGFLHLNETTGDVSVSRSDRVISRWKVIGQSENSVTAYTVVAVNVNNGHQLATTTLLLAANLTDEDEDDGPIEFDRSLFSGQLATDALLGTVAAKLMLTSYRMKAKYTISAHSTMFLDKMKRLVLKTKNPFDIQPDGRVILTGILPNDRQISSILFRVEARQLNASLFSDPAAVAVVAIYLNPARKPTPNSRAQLWVPQSTNDSVVNVQVPETAPIGYVIAVLPAMDPITGDVVLAAGFTIPRVSPWLEYIGYDSQSGILSLKKQIDFESMPPNSNPIILKLAAGGDAKNGSVTTLNITVLDENDNPPEFEREIYIAHLPEDAQSGRVVLTLNFFDNDTSGNSFSFSLDGGNGNFQLRRSGKDDHSVQVAVAPLAHFDYELGQRLFSLAVTVRDGINRENTADVFIQIDDSNDHAPRFLKSEYVAQVTEAQPIGSALFKASAVDEDVGDRVLYELSSVDAPDLFIMDPVSGVVTVAKSLSHRARPEPYTLHISGTDGQKSVSVTGQIYVLEASAGLADQRSANSLLQFVQPPLGFVLTTTEDSQILYTAQAIDIRAQRQGSKPVSTLGGVVYSLGEVGWYDQFSVDTYTGEVRTSRHLDYEDGRQYSIVLMARSAVEETNETSQEQVTHVARLLNIQFEDTRDHRPHFQRTQDSIPVVFTVPEHADGGHILGRVHASQEDSQRIHYQLTCGNQQGLFNVDGESGLISLSQPIRSSKSTTHTLCLRAISGNHANKTLASLQNLNVLIRVESEAVEAEIDLRSANTSMISLGTTAIADRHKTLEMEKLKAMPRHLTYDLANVQFVPADSKEASREIVGRFGVIASTGELTIDPGLFGGPEGVYQVAIDVYKDGQEAVYYDTLVHYVNVVREAHKLRFVFDMTMSILESKQSAAYQKLVQAVRQASNGDLELVLDSPAPQDSQNKRSSVCFHAVQNRTRIVDRLVTLRRMEELAQTLLPVYQMTSVIDIQDCAAPIETASVKPTEMALFIFAGSLTFFALLTALIYYVFVKKHNSRLPSTPEKTGTVESAISETPPPSPSNQLVPRRVIVVDFMTVVTERSDFKAHEKTKNKES